MKTTYRNFKKLDGGLDDKMFTSIHINNTRIFISFGLNLQLKLFKHIFIHDFIRKINYTIFIYKVLSIKKTWIPCILNIKTIQRSNVTDNGMHLHFCKIKEFFLCFESLFVEELVVKWCKIFNYIWIALSTSNKNN